MNSKVEVIGVGCMGLCSEGPLVMVEPEGTLYGKVKPEEATDLIGALNGGKCKIKKIDLNHPSQI